MKPVNVPDMPEHARPASVITLGEDMARPLGPLEEGDQAIVEAAQKIPTGEQAVEQDGGIMRVMKYGPGLGGGEQVIVAKTGADRSVEQTSTSIHYDPRDPSDLGRENIGVVMVKRPAPDTYEKGSYTRVAGDKIEPNPDPDPDGPSIQPPKRDRKEVQAIKLEVAGKIDAARKHLGEAGIEGAQRAA